VIRADGERGSGLGWEDRVLGSVSRGGRGGREFVSVCCGVVHLREQDAARTLRNAIRRTRVSGLVRGFVRVDIAAE
jgi:hypothetical protein